MDFNDNLNDPKQEVLDLVSNRISAIKRRLGEIKSQLDQTQLMVDREQARNTSLASELQNIQSNLDTVPREDIRDKYNDAIDARFRLATMRGQLEKFQSYYEYLEQEKELLSQVLTPLQGAFLDTQDDFNDDVGEGGLRAPVNLVRIVEAQEDERRRLANQMHDGPAQSLTNFILQAEICQRLFNRNPERAADELDALKSAASVTFQKVRDFIFDLRPMMLDDLGVAPTVRRYIESYKEKNDIEVEFKLMGEERRLEKILEVMVFRNIQDLMVYARDYAAPSNIRVHLDMGTSTIKIMVSDNGRGFDADGIFEDENPQDPRAQGYMMIKEKLDLMGGTITVGSSDNEGTNVRLELPVNG